MEPGLTELNSNFLPKWDTIMYTSQEDSLKGKKNMQEDDNSKI